MSPKHHVPRDPERHRREALEIGRRIRALRQARNMTQGDVAGSRFTKAYISAMETGGALPSMTSLQYLASQLRVPPAWFLTPEADAEHVALPATIWAVRFADRRVYVDLDDGRAIGMPLDRSRKLMNARVEQLDGWEIVESGRAVSWPEIGEEMRLEDFLGMRLLRPAEARKALLTRGGGASDVVVPPAAEPLPARRAVGRRNTRPSGYEPLIEWLAGQPDDEVRATFADIERVLGRSLTPSAQRYSGPWYSAANQLGATIARAGWRASVQLGDRLVTLRKR
jgi:transcriptional regulator with XRE-family HTH domain